ncbi:MAG: PQQ-binding-like beta-propeller repeat protein [Spirochaetales bacterium]|nr:PQQ-binding-like beta-propeller repeat protein [Spirochaetales bacterium]
MKARVSYKKQIFFTTIIILAFITGCTPDTANLPENVKKGEKSISTGIVNSPAVVVFYIGNCYRFNNSDWELLSIGQCLKENDTIKVGPDSYLEIQIGNRAIICIEENTEVILESLFYELDSKEIKLHLKEGSLFSTLKKLLYNETFEVETPKVILSIRGTQFLVKENQEETLVAVKEGSVMLLPPGINKPGTQDNDRYKKMIEQVTVSLQKEAPVLLKEKEIIITKGTAFHLKKEIEPVLSYIEDSIKDKRDITEDQLLLRVKDIKKSMHALENRITDWQIDTKKEIQGKKQVSDISLPEDTKGMDILLKESTIVEVNVDFDKALVYMDNTLIGKQRMGILYNPEKQFSFSVVCPGYEDTVFNVKTKAGIHYSYNVRLLKEEEKSPGDMVYEEETETWEVFKKETTGPEKDAITETIVTIKTEPEDSAIYINGEFTGYGTYTGQFKKGDKLSIFCMREGYYDATMNATIEDWGVKENYTISLISKVDGEPRFSVSNTEIIGQMEYNKGILYVADKYGSLFAVDTSGKTIWTVSTNNNPNEHSFPVVIGNRLYFSGSDELVILDTSSGSLLARRALNADEAHYFGRYLIPYKDQGIYPANNALKIMDMQTAEFIKEFPCPGGSRMTPVIFNDMLYIVNQQGVLLKMDPETGIIKKEIPTQAQMPVALPVTIKDNYIYFADSKSHIVCMDSVKEQVRWEKDISGEKATVYHMLICGEKSINIFVRGTLYNLSLEDGTERFSPVPDITCPPLYKSGMLIFGTTDGFLTFLNEEDGTVAAKINVEQKITTRPVLAGNKLLIGTETGTVFVIASL